MRILRSVLMGLAAALMAASLASCQVVDGVIAFTQIGHDLGIPAAAPPARMDIVGGTPVIHLYGGPQDQGRQYGRLLQRPLQDLHRCINDFTTAQRYAQVVAYAQRHEFALPPELRDELHAVSDASGMPYLELVVLNITPTMDCSALATWDDRAATTMPAATSGPAGLPVSSGPPVVSGDANRRLIMGRNADYFSFGFGDRGMLVVVCHPNLPGRSMPMVTVAFLGMVGAFTGMNARGVAFGNMLVTSELKHRREDGLTIQLALRLAAEHAATADQMADRLTEIKHVIPMNVMVADPRHALALELDRGAVRVRQGDHGVLACTNHFMKPPIVCPADSCVRYDKLLAAARAGGGPLTVEQMKHALWTARGIDNIQAVVFEPAALRMHVSINHSPAAGGPYITLDFHDLFSPQELAAAAATQP